MIVPHGGKNEAFTFNIGDLFWREIDDSSHLPANQIRSSIKNL
jgi:hypothetical protein